MIEQFGVLAWKESEDGHRHVLLITSRETKRWVIPRGNPIAGLSPAQAAAQEAWEEAGIRGETGAEPIGAFAYQKRRFNGALVPAEVHVFEMRVTEEARSWPEAHERERRWFVPGEAAAAVDEPDLKVLLLREARDGA
ncbi:MAG TPA: NUDIX hydrolase [Allosphingosinicella sp.]